MTKQKIKQNPKISSAESSLSSMSHQLSFKNRSKTKQSKCKKSSTMLLEDKLNVWSYTDSYHSNDSSYSYHLIENIPFVKKNVSVHKGKKTTKKIRRKVELVEQSSTKISIKEKTKKKTKKKPKKYLLESVVQSNLQNQINQDIDRVRDRADSSQALKDSKEEIKRPVKRKPKKKAQGPKKKLSKKEKQRLAAEQAEKARINAEEEAARQAELERIRLEEERKAAIEKEKREAYEQQIRVELLEGSLEQLNALIDHSMKKRQQALDLSQWEFYVNCGRLPNPRTCNDMNTFLHLWENLLEKTTIKEAAERTIDVLELLRDLDNLIDTTKNSKFVENWKWVRLLFREQQAKSLDVATYRLLRDIEKNLNRIDIPTADYKYQDNNIALGLWLRIQLPSPLPNPRRPPKPRIEIAFSEIKIEVQFPISVTCENMAIRALYVRYDHLSDLSDSYQAPPTPEQYDIDLYNAIKKEWRTKLIYKYKKRKQTQQNDEVPTEFPNETIAEANFISNEDIPFVPYQKLEPSASDYAISEEDLIYADVRSRLAKIVPSDIINLRKYSIIGGVFSLNLIHQPPQPQNFVTMKMTLTPLILPKELQFVEFYVKYSPPPPPEPGVRRLPEEIEEEMKKQEEELEKLILVTLTWPDHVIFLELPMVCFWDNCRKVWTKAEIHDLKHNEEKGQLTFRTGQFGTFALATYRYSNLPYQAWEMRPELNDSVTVQITAAILMVEFNIKDGKIALSQLQNSPNNALQDIIGIYYALPKLIRIMQDAGVDVFPAFDAFCYMENTCEKHWPMEKHLYFNMSELACCFNFAWSRWNLAAGRRNIILQMREYNLEKAKQKNHLMLHVTPLSATYIDCTEVSQTFNDVGIENMKFYPDLFCLMKGTTRMALKNKIAKVSQNLVYALYELLLATRVLSFS